jgi:hypothetical protein
MALRITANVLTIICILFAFYLGVAFLFFPETSAAGVGFDVWPTGEAAQFLNMKGVRDFVTGVIPLTFLALGQRRALGLSLLCIALVPVGDGTAILLNGGSVAAALGIHYTTAVFVAVTGLVNLQVARRA